jgi:hypothetical protein
MNRALLAFISLLLATIVVAALLLQSEDSTTQELGKELGKMVGQVLLVTLAGGVLLQEYGRRRDLKAAAAELRKTMLSSLVESYMQTKKCRRLLRAKSRLPLDSPPASFDLALPQQIYEESMGTLNDTQLELEWLIQDLHSFPSAFHRRDEIRKPVDKMKNYLGTLITEYETSLRTDREAGMIRWARLERLSDFLHGKKGSYFRQNFTRCFHEAVALMRVDLLPPG